MKHIKSINELFGFFKKKDDEEDKIALEFIKRLEKVKGESPYKISKLDPNIIINYYIDGELNHQGKTYINERGNIYEVVFDDVVIRTIFLPKGSDNNANVYGLVVDDDKLRCKTKYREGIYRIVKSIYDNTERLKVVNKMKRNINPAADLLESKKSKKSKKSKISKNTQR